MLETQVLLRTVEASGSLEEAQARAAVMARDLVMRLQLPAGALPEGGDRRSVWDLSGRGRHGPA